MYRFVPLIALGVMTGLVVIGMGCSSGSSAKGASSVPVTGSGGDSVALTQIGDSGIPGVSATGTGRATGTPDVAVLNMGVQTQASTVQEANTQAQDAMDSLMSTLRSNGVEEDDIQTQYFNISPQYGSSFAPDRQPQIIGYQVSNSVNVKVRNIDDVSKVIDSSVSAVGDPLQVNGISLSIDDPTELQDAARENAVSVAKEKAQKLAQLAGVGLGDPVFVSEDSAFTSPPSPAYDARLLEAQAAGSTPISPGELEVQVTVRLVYAIQ